jgi:hypothetical protein
MKRFHRARVFGALALVASAVPACTCARKHGPSGQGEGPGELQPTASATDGSGPSLASSAGASSAADAGSQPRFSAPIAAARLAGSGDIVVAGLDVAARAIRVQRVGTNDEVKLDRTVLENVAWTRDADLKLAFVGASTSLVWRGTHRGKVGRFHLALGADLAPRGEPTEVGAASCSTHELFLHADAHRLAAIPLAPAPSGSAASRASASAPAPVDVPKEREIALVCGAHRAFVVLEHEEGADLGVVTTGPSDAGTSLLAQALVTRPLLREADVGDDARERAEYVVADELGVVRLAGGGALAWRETKDGRPGPLKRLQKTIPQDDDVVAVDASSSVVVVVYTQEVLGACEGTPGPATKVVALRLDRATGAESTLDLAPPSCGREIGPFFTSAAGAAVNVSWVERVPTVGRARPPIAALAHVAVPLDGAPRAALRVEVEADALADAGCDAQQCVAAALVRQSGMDAMVPGLVRVLRYAP